MKYEYGLINNWATGQGIEPQAVTKILRKKQLLKLATLAILLVILLPAAVGLLSTNFGWCWPVLLILSLAFLSSMMEMEKREEALIKKVDGDYGNLMKVVKLCGYNYRRWLANVWEKSDLLVEFAEQSPTALLTESYQDSELAACLWIGLRNLAKKVENSQAIAKALGESWETPDEDNKIKDQIKEGVRVGKMFGLLPQDIIMSNFFEKKGPKLLWVS